MPRFERALRFLRVRRDELCVPLQLDRNPRDSSQTGERQRSDLRRLIPRRPAGLL